MSKQLTYRPADQTDRQLLHRLLLALVESGNVTVQRADGTSSSIYRFDLSQNGRFLTLYTEDD